MKRILLFAAALIAVSCSMQEETAPVCFQASIEDMSTKTSVNIGTETASVVWKEGDAIKVFSRTNLQGVRFVAQNVDGKKAEFVSDASSSLGEGPYWAASPYDGNITFDGENITCSPATSQTRSSDMAGENPMIAYSEGTSLSFKNTGGILMLNLTGDAVISSIKVSEGDSYWKTVCPMPVKLPATFMIAVPEGAFKSGLTAEFTNSSGKSFSATAGPICSGSGVPRSYIVQMPSFECSTSKFNGQQAGQISSVSVNLNGQTLETYTYNYDSSGSLTGVKVTRNALSSGFEGGWDDYSFVTIKKGTDGKPSSRTASRAFSSSYYSASRSHQTSFGYQNGCLSTSSTSIVTRTSSSHYTRTMGTGEIARQYYYSELKDSFNIGGLLQLESCEAETAKWLCEGWPGNAYLPSSISTTVGGIAVRTDSFDYSLDSSSRVKTVARMVVHYGTYSDTYVYTISYK